MIIVLDYCGWGTNSLMVEIGCWLSTDTGIVHGIWHIWHGLLLHVLSWGCSGWVEAMVLNLLTHLLSDSSHIITARPHVSSTGNYGFTSLIRHHLLLLMNAWRSLCWRRFLGYWWWPPITDKLDWKWNLRLIVINMFLMHNDVRVNVSSLNDAARHWLLPIVQCMRMMWIEVLWVIVMLNMMVLSVRHITMVMWMV